jgi:hypothetical protein
MSTSILDTIKAELGLEADYEAFDKELVTHINSSLAQLTQLGVGSSSGFVITDKTATWAQFFGEADDPVLAHVKSYIFLNVKLLFDPPQVGFVLTAMKQQVEKFEWLIEIAANPAPEIVPIETEPVE